MTSKTRQRGPWQAPLRQIARVLRAGGRFVCELGGRGNVAHLLQAAATAAQAVGAVPVDPGNYFPSIGDYTPLVETAGLEVRMAQLFDRLTPLEGAEGLVGWVRMFRPELIESVGPEREAPFIERLEAEARRVLWRNGSWHADYRRLRLVAIKR